MTYNADGTWTVAPFSLVKRADSTPLLLPAAEATNAQVLNEAGTAQLATGYAANFQLPVTIQNLTNIAAIHVRDEYQIGPIGGQRTGAICIAINGNSATFA